MEMALWNHFSWHIDLVTALKWQYSKVKTDILKAMDKQEVVYLVLLDLSSVFDTVNHGTPQQVRQEVWSMRFSSKLDQVIYGRLHPTCSAWRSKHKWGQSAKVTLSF